MFRLHCLLLLITVGGLHAGIEISREKCQWRGAFYGDFSKCDGDEITVGACGSGKSSDCGENMWTSVYCCAFEGFYYGNCELQSSVEYGVPLSCIEDNVSAHIAEAMCGSGTRQDCQGYSHRTECCEGHVNGELVGSSGQCAWKYTHNWGEQLVCGRSDEAVMGICGSGGDRNCPGDSSHCILCIIYIV
ncbi:uncharacterized protein LOC111697416 isoform X2 [Eurytemora carolleeae]|uniref:uncharacterized protein LOC111697416 isoform X2 n=1 Tax=Eurytemora carolleeae TaxID=1294199 RepID=UPI000C75785C|nr:uncharacterized protein LOC111697416 isoform X2 [Eurytemora carolleeae]|eukprot:XP_023323204.1 uncharacterized protein LOC111697416 isoform X2 [Eurytemora affinis]